jgi:hypothetical protein
MCEFHLITKKRVINQLDFSDSENSDALASNYKIPVNVKLQRIHCIDLYSKSRATASLKQSKVN